MSEPLYLPAAERVEVIKNYAKLYNIRYFIETGTSEGETVAALLGEFDHITTIEIDRDLHLQATIRFAGCTSVSCLLGDSALVLPEVVASHIEPVIFWLDGHYCGGPGRGEIDTPIVEEVRAALQAPTGSVILIDDARLFGGMPEHTEEFKDYPHVNWVKETVEAVGYSYWLNDDIIRLTPA